MMSNVPSNEIASPLTHAHKPRARTPDAHYDTANACRHHFSDQTGGILAAACQPDHRHRFIFTGTWHFHWILSDQKGKGGSVQGF